MIYMMRAWPVMGGAWPLLWLLLLFSSTLFSCQGTILSQVRKIALDSTRPLRTMRLKALCAPFINTHPLWIQLWSKTSSGAIFRLDWQVRISPRYGDGSMEVVNLHEKNHFNIDPLLHVMAIMNERLPGPLNGRYQPGSGLILCLLDRNHMGLPLNISTLFAFDNLRLPYHLPVLLCNQTGCPYERDIPPSPRVSPLPTDNVERTAGLGLVSEEMVVGLITWNILLTLLLLIIILILLIVICGDLEKRRKDSSSCRSSCSSRYSGTLYSLTHFPRVMTSDLDTPGMIEVTDSDPDRHYSWELSEKMPSARF